MNLSSPRSFLVGSLSRRPARRGFTLVEILVVVAIIAVLAALSIAGISSALRSARRAACVGHMRSIGVAVLNYGVDNNLNFPLTDNLAWDVPLNSYLGQDSTTTANPVLKCPEDSRPLISGGNFARSYSMSGGLPAKTNDVAAPSTTIMLAEWYSGGTNGPGGAGSNFQYGGAFDTVNYSIGMPAPASGSAGYHGATSNFLFVDGHVESLPPISTTTPLSMWPVESSTTASN